MNIENLAAPPNTKRDNKVMLAGIIIAVVFIPLASSLTLPFISPGLPRLLVSRLVTWADILLLYFYAKKVERKDFLLWAENWYDVSFYIKWMFLLFLLILCCGVISRIPALFGLRESNAIALKLMALVKSNMFAFIFTLITAGVTEEVILRGYILPRFEAVIKNQYIALIITSLLFSALHYGYHNIGELIFTFCFAIVFGSHYRNYRSLSLLMVMHALVDLVALSVNHSK